MPREPKHLHHVSAVDHEEHRKTCVVCSTLGLRRTDFEFKVREFTPAGEIIQLSIMQTMERLEDQDIRWVLEHATTLVPPAPTSKAVPKQPATWQWTVFLIALRLTVLIMFALLLAVLLDDLVLFLR